MRSAVVAGVLSFRRMQRPGATASAWLALAALLASAGTHAARRDFYFEPLPAQAALAQLTITDLLQDRDGYVWIATQDGLHRYDGQRMLLLQRSPDQPDSLPDSLVTALAQGVERSLWIGTQTGYVARLDTATGRVATLPVPAGSSAAVRDLLHRPGQGLWIATASGVDFLPEGAAAAQPRFTAPEGGSPVALADDEAGTLWVGTSRGLYRLGGHGGELLWRGAGISCLLPAPGGLLLGTPAGLFQFTSADGQVRRIWPAADSGQRPLPVRALARDRQGYLWLALTGRGLLRLDLRSGQSQRVRERPGLAGGLPEDSVRTLMLDRSGLLWVGGSLRGVATVDPAGTRFEFIFDDASPQGPIHGNSIRAILPDGTGRLWLGTDGDGLKRYDPASDRFERFEAIGAPVRDEAPDDAGPFVNGLLDDRGWVWAATERGLFRIRPDGSGAEPVRSSLRPDPLAQPLRQMALGAADEIWIGSRYGGLLRYRPEGGQVAQYRWRAGDPESLSSDFVHVVLEDERGMLWVGTEDGLDMLDRVTGKFQRFRYDPADPESISDDRVRALHRSPTGEVWVGTHAGLNRLRQGSDGRWRFERHTRIAPDDPAALIVFAIQEDAAGRLWLSSSRGILRFDPASRLFRRYAPRDGLQDVEFNGSAFAALAGGRMAFGGVSGLNLFDPARMDDSDFLPQPVLLSARFGADQSSRRGWWSAPEEIALPQRARTLRLGFGALDFAGPGSLRYRYRLLGFDSDWVEAGSQPEAVYTNLPPGDYRFEVLASNHDGVWSEQALSVPVRIDPPWWASAWAYLAYVLALSGASGWTARRVSARRRQEKALLRELGQREERLKLALWGSGDEFWDWDIKLNRIFRLGADRLLGNSDPEQTLDLELWRSEAIHPDDLERVQQVLQEHVLGKTEYFESEHRVRNAHGAWIWVRSRGKIVERDANGDPLRMAGTARDITASRHAEREQRAANEVLRSMSEAVAVVDLDFRFVSVNPAFSRITGYSQADVIGQSSQLLDSVQHSAEFYQRMREVLVESGHWAGEMWQRRKDGEEFLGWLEISEVKDSEGKRSHYVAVVNDITDKKRAEQELRYLANYDTLTGLPNRALLSERLARAIVRARRQDTRIAVLFLDLDRFKDINDSLGHSAGDRILKAAAARLLATVGPSDTVARLGGDEFTVVMEDVETLDTVEAGARRILEAFARPLEIDERNDVSITPSVGVSLYPDHGLVPTDLLKFADTAMYQAKAAGRNTFQVYTEVLDAQIRQRATLAAALRRALDRGEFRLLFQPRLSLADGRITGVEALLRWHSQELGDIPPMEFIPLAEESGLILQIGEWVLREACMTLRRWRHGGLTEVSMAFNVSVLQLLRGNLPETVARVIAEVDVPADRLEMEVTESMVMANAEQTTATLHAMRKIGLSIAIDDFGTGYSSLVYLKRLPIDTLKIDKEFVGDLTTDPDDEAITATIINMAHSLGLNVIAEGVETQQQLDYLRQQGCDEIQGYWLSPPLDGHHCLAFMRTWQPAAGAVPTEMAAPPAVY